ncbi:MULTISPECIES: PadR family transcriptional regulator [unclassified Curtobacterium]|uniref:PadR family transcriptional regulator n=1 Tax=unclassified Curtobacterium TaxID=257496 RepID=UPI000DA907D4|nr:MULTISPECIES: helix-turn-helix transcriptional regulator [unclassified Curtobacterium]PZE32843.1 PadR family transcriptional regulator [Curtobacterium sp. MCPF17_031]PZF11948.1 PadR family transcriptional regulator [Curtobacterium sp. MCPF17_011]
MEPLTRVTASTIDVLAALLDHDGSVWGLLVIKATERPAGTVYPILERLEDRGWITSTWEADSERSGPRRRLYEFTTDGRAAAVDACAAFRRRQTPERRPSGRTVTS